MNMIEIKPIKKLDAELSVPGSKSYTNRALLVAALTEGKSVLKNALFSEDTRHMAQALREFGIDVKEKKDCFEVLGSGGRIKTPKKDVFVGNAGTAMRSLTTFAALAEGEVVITGNGRMQERPIQDLIDGLKCIGVEVKSKKNNGCPPVIVSGGGIKGGKIRMKGNTSSQYFTSIMLSAPYAQKDVEIEVIGELTSKPYIDVTIDIMKEFGVKVENGSYKRFRIKAGQRYRAREYSIEGDASNASYFFGAAAITGGTARINNLDYGSAQGDAHFVDVLEKMGCKVEKGKGWIKVKGGKLKGVKMNMNRMPDVVQTLAVVAAFADGKTQAYDVANMRIKETDRIEAVKNELTKMGIKVDAKEGSITIHGGTPAGAEIDTYKDHRMAMSFAIAGLKIPGVRIKDPECVNKTFPDFFERLKELYK